MIFRLAVLAIFFFGGIIVSVAATNSPGWARVIVVWVPLAGIVALVWSAQRKHARERVGDE